MTWRNLWINCSIYWTWSTQKRPRTAVKFSPTFATLGLLFELSECDSGVVTIKHTDNRRAEILGTLDQVFEEKILSAKQADLLVRKMWLVRV